jgi:hypothetical protein
MKITTEMMKLLGEGNLAEEVELETAEQLQKQFQSDLEKVMRGIAKVELASGYTNNVGPIWRVTRLPGVKLPNNQLQLHNAMNVNGPQPDMPELKALNDKYANLLRKWQIGSLKFFNVTADYDGKNYDNVALVLTGDADGKQYGFHDGWKLFKQLAAGRTQAFMKAVVAAAGAVSDIEGKAGEYETQSLYALSPKTAPKEAQKYIKKYEAEIKKREQAIEVLKALL